MRRREGDVPNRGGERSPRRATGRTASFVFSGALRWVERDGSCAVLLVADANALGRRLIGQTLTLDLTATSIVTPDRDGDGRRSGRDLLPGEQVTIKARLPRATVSAASVVAPGRLVAEGP